MEQTERSETSAYKILTPGNYPEESVQLHFFKVFNRRRLQLRALNTDKHEHLSTNYQHEPTDNEGNPRQVTPSQQITSIPTYVYFSLQYTKFSHRPTTKHGETKMVRYLNTYSLTMWQQNVTFQIQPIPMPTVGQDPKAPTD